MTYYPVSEPRCVVILRGLCIFPNLPYSCLSTSEAIASVHIQSAHIFIHFLKPDKRSVIFFNTLRANAYKETVKIMEQLHSKGYGAVRM